MTIDHQGTNLPRSIQSSMDNSLSSTWKIDASRFVLLCGGLIVNHLAAAFTIISSRPTFPFPFWRPRGRMIGESQCCQVSSLSPSFFFLKERRERERRGDTSTPHQPDPYLPLLVWLVAVLRCLSRSLPLRLTPAKEKRDLDASTGPLTPHRNGFRARF